MNIHSLLRNRITSVSLAVLALAYLLVMQYQFAVQHPGGNDSIPRWVGTKAWFYDGLNPYSDEVTLRSQIANFGRPALPTEDKQLFVYPFYVVFFYLPTIWLTYEWARAIWMMILEACLIGVALLSRRMYHWSPPTWLMALTLGWVILFYHGVRTIILWQMAGLVALLITLGLWALKNKRDILSGVCLALATIKPQMVFLILPLVAVWGLTARRYKVTISMTVSMAALAGISFALMPSWLSDMLRQIWVYPSYTEIGSPLNIITTIVFPYLGRPMEWSLIAMLLLWVFWEWWHVRRGSDDRFDWVIALTLLVTNFVATRTATTNYLMMLPVLFYLFAYGERKFNGRSYSWVAAFELAYFAGLYALFAFTLVGNTEHWSLYLPLPLLLLAGLLFVRFDQAVT
jgi:hypothetical protein